MFDSGLIVLGLLVDSIHLADLAGRAGAFFLTRTGRTYCALLGLGLDEQGGL